MMFKTYTVVLSKKNIKELCQLEILSQFKQLKTKIKLCNEFYTVLQINYQNSLVHSPLSNINCLYSVDLTKYFPIL